MPEIIQRVQSKQSWQLIFMEKLPIAQLKKTQPCVYYIVCITIDAQSEVIQLAQEETIVEEIIDGIKKGHDTLKEEDIIGFLILIVR